MALKLIIDCDPGNGLPATDVDDGLALALAWASPDVDLAAVTVVEGNVDRDTGTRVARALVELAGCRTPVYRGAAPALVEPAGPWRSALAARREEPGAAELWAGVQPRLSGAVEVRRDAVEVLIELVTGSPGTYTLVAIGPLTNVARAQIRHTGFLAALDRLVILGGAFTGPLGVRELNFAMDPEAADLVLGGGARTTLVPLDLTRRTFLTPDDVARLGCAASPLVRYLAATAKPWVRWIVEGRSWPGANLHDVVAVAAAVRPDLLTTEAVPVAVELTGDLTRSRPVRLPLEVGAPYGPPPLVRNRPAVDVAVDLDLPRFMAMLRDRLTDYRSGT